MRAHTRLVVTIRYEMLVIYDADNDKEHPMFPEESVLTWWLDKHESEHAGLTTGQVELDSQLISRQAEQWLQDPDSDE